jgi:hypothetical protein
MKRIKSLIKILLLSLPLFGVYNGCGKEYSCENCNTPEPAKDSSIYCDLTIDGKRLYILKGENGTQLTYGGMRFGPSFCIDNFELTCLGTVDEKPLFAFFKGRQPLVWNYSQVNTFYPTGEHPFLAINPNPVSCCPCTYFTDGVAIQLRDTNEEVWNSFYGTADQTGNYFRIVKLEGQDPDLYVTASFECNIYNSNGRVKKITNGSFRLKVW